LDDRNLLVYILVCFALVAAVIYIGLVFGWIGTPRDGFPDGPPLPPPNTIHLEQGNTTQTLPTWLTEFFVTGLQGNATYPLGNLTFAVIEGGDAIRMDVNMTLHDLDGDGNASLGDILEISNMTDDVNGAVLEVYLDDVNVAHEDIIWDTNDPLIYSAFLYWNYPVTANGSSWDTNFSVTHLGILHDVHPSNLSFDVMGGDGEPLEDALVVFEDWREDGLLSDFDRVHVLGMTEDYQRARVRMHLDGTLVAMGTIPQWIY
jgi:hypothetical protein